MDNEFLECIVSISINEFNPADMEKQKYFGLVETNIKNLFRIIIPNMPIADKIGDICSVLLEKDYRPIL